MVMRISNAVVGVLNSLTLLLSLPVIGAALWLSLRAAALSECGRFLHLPLLVVGAALFVTSLLGLIGSFFRVSGFLWAYLAVLTLVILAVLAFSVVAVAVTNRGVGRALSGKGYQEYRLGHYSQWLQRRVHEWKNWKVIASCLRDGKVCGRGGGFAGIMVGLLFRQNLPLIQSGCCKPPKYCKFKNMNSTWTIPDSATASSTPDCLAWSNNLHKLCFSCSSCKAGVVAVLRRGWKKLTIANLVLLIVVVIIYSLTCCAMTNKKPRRPVTGAHP